MLGQSPKGENCLICKERAEGHQKNQIPWLEKGDALLAEAVARGTKAIWSVHYRKRAAYRCFAGSEIAAAIENGFVIERQFRETDTVWLIGSNIKTGYKKYRPVHIAVIFEQDAILVITAYDPRSENWRWDSTFCKRVCWCKKHKNEV